MIWDKNMAIKKYNEKSEWVNKYDKRIRRTSRRPRKQKNIDLLKTTVKKYQIGKHQAMMECMYSISRNSPPLTIN